jgi:hypothetical protein
LTEQGGIGGATNELVIAGTLQGAALAEEALTRLHAAGIQGNLEPERVSPRTMGADVPGEIHVRVIPSDLERARQIIEEVSHEHDVRLVE